MNKQSVIQVSAYYPPHLGGQEYAVQSLANQLAKTGRHVDVFTSAMGETGTQQELNGPRVVRAAGFEIGHAPVMPSLPLLLLTNTNRHSLVHLHVGQAFTPEVVWLVSKFKRYRYIVQLHIDFAPSGPLGFLLPIYKNLLLRRVIQGAAAVVVLNKDAANLVHDVYKYNGLIQVINNGIDEEFFNCQRHPSLSRLRVPLNLLFVGRLTKQKNLISLLKALPLIDGKVHLDVIGEGEERPMIEQAIKQLGLKNVRLHGQLSRPEVLKLYTTHHALVMPSLYEAQPMVLLEAMAARIPIIGTNVVGVAEHLQGFGIVVEPTPQDLSRGINELISGYRNLSPIVNRAHQRAGQHRWSTLLQQYEALYDAVAKD